MNNIAIKVENLSKLYRIGQRERYYALRDVLTNALTAPFRLFNNHPKPNTYSLAPSTQQPATNSIWALKDVAFEVKQGEVVGIIGRNGAGKSTLLKILSRITEPTDGYAEIHGRIGSLLEVGTGFHPELTGRENIYLNGAILGMTKKEIDRKFDEIVVFAEVEKFLDTPVKRYSSGMQVRLAFAVAAHLEPEILLVDEVLAVGDAAFQKKCLGKMGNVAKEGRTVILISHQLNQIRRLCAHCLWLNTGCIRMYGPTVEVVSAYETEISGVSENERRGNTEESARLGAQFLRWEIFAPRSIRPNILTTLETCAFKIFVQVNKPIRNGSHGIALWNNDGQLMWARATYNLDMRVGIYELVYTLPGLPLRPGVYHLQVNLLSEDGALLDNWYCVPELIIATEHQQNHHLDEWNGVLNLPCDFRVKSVE